MKLFTKSMEVCMCVCVCGGKEGSLVQLNYLTCLVVHYLCIVIGHDHRIKTVPGKMVDCTDDCIQCLVPVRARQEGLQCDMCGRWQHRKCNTGVSRADYWAAVKSGNSIDWNCNTCTFTDEPTSHPVDDPSTPDMEHEPHIPAVEQESSVDDPPDLPMELEDSLDDPAIQDVELQSEGEFTFQLFEKGTQRGRDKLVDSHGYTYNKKMQRSNVTYWQCTNRPKSNPCKALVTQRNGKYVKNNVLHNHSPSTGSDIVTKVTLQVKKLAAQDLFKPASAIVDDVLLQEIGNAPCPSLPKPEHLARTANRQRQILRPTEPKNLNFEVDVNHIPDDFLIADVSVRERRHLIFATTEQIKHLTRAKSWYIDSTFKLCRHPFTQLMTVNAFVRADDYAKQVPLLFVIMSGRKKSDYRKVFHEVLTSLPNEPSVKHTTIDYEKAMWKVLPEVLPNAKVKGCVFHWTQAVWRKVQEVGLQHAYKHDDGTYKYLRKVMALPFLPEADIGPVFERLSRQAATAQLQTIMQYISRTWIHNSLWPTSSWSIFYQSIRTNNDIEGWHNRLNKHAAGRCNLQFYLLVSLLHKEAKLTSVYIRLVSEKKLRRIQRKKYRDLQGKIFTLWEEHMRGERSAYQLLKACAYLNGPVRS
ncbi:uncharacterized protein [Palaemon carinicauda]|uniref:uncharacterized protein n=1 Tax=Palaemon carinicauda TaxID=392227 RepID=UPI0035B5D4BB